MNSAAAKSTSEATSSKEPRSERRKRERRLRLMKAAFNLMSERGKDEVTIQEITEAADVGFGTFYNYFDSKEAIFSTLLTEVIEHSALKVDQTARQLPDAAERLSVGVRNTLLQAQSDPVWGGFLTHAPHNGRIFARGLGKFLKRDLQEGIAEGRFNIDDPELTLLAVSSTVIGVLSAELDRNSCAAEALATPAEPEPGRSEDIAERTAAMVLRIVGVEDAEEVARRPLPALTGFLNIFE